MKAIALVVLSLLSCTNFSQKRIYQNTEKATHALEMEYGVCSGTSLSEYVILTADHCFPDNTAVKVKIDGRTAHIRKIARDGNDHVLLLIDIAFSNKASYANGKLRKGDKVFYYGNPGIRQMFRSGTVAGFNENATLFDVNGWHGDSGAAIFNDDGKIVAVVSQGFVNGIFKLIVTYPIAFTDEQYKSFGVI